MSRKKAAAPPTPPPPPAPPAPRVYRQTLHLGLDDLDLENLDKIKALMKRDPIWGRLKDNIGREKAARWAIAYCVANATA